MRHTALVARFLGILGLEFGIVFSILSGSLFWFTGMSLQ
jgi:hypothetical protein